MNHINKALMASVALPISPCQSVTYGHWTFTEACGLRTSQQSPLCCVGSNLKAFPDKHVCMQQVFL